MGLAHWKLWPGPGHEQEPLGTWASPRPSPWALGSIYRPAVGEAPQISAQGRLRIRNLRNVLTLVLSAADRLVPLPQPLPPMKRPPQQADSGK